MTVFGFERQIMFVEINQVDVLDAELRGVSATQVPDGLRDAAGDEPAVRQDNLLEPFKNLAEPLVLSQRAFQLVERCLPDRHRSCLNRLGSSSPRPSSTG